MQPPLAATNSLLGCTKSFERVVLLSWGEVEIQSIFYSCCITSQGGSAPSVFSLSLSFMPKFARRGPSGCWAGGSTQLVPLLEQGGEPNAKARQSRGLIHHSRAESMDLHVQAHDGSRACCLSWVSLPCHCSCKQATRFPQQQHGVGWTVVTGGSGNNETKQHFAYVGTEPCSPHLSILHAYTSPSFSLTPASLCPCPLPKKAGDK